MESDANPGRCPTCGTSIDPSLADLGCSVCLIQAGLETKRPNEPALSQQFGSYRILRRGDGAPDELGRGAMGITYRAIDVTLNRQVALKIIDPRQHGDDRARERFTREARSAAALRHPNIATIHHFGVQEDTGQYFYAMELVEGETLEERVHRSGPVGVRTAIAIAKQVVAGIAAATKHRVVHRDLKPGNIMLVGTDAEVPEVKIIDFGLAKAVEETQDPMTVTRGFVGSPAFASPEQFVNRALDVRSDIYSLGATLWFALTGKTPFRGRSVEEIRDAQQATPVPVQQLKAARIPARLTELLTSMLAVEPAARPGIAEIEAKLQGPDHTGRTWLAGSVLAATAAIVVGAITFLLNRPHHNIEEGDTSDPAAHEAFLKGRYAFSKRDGSDFETSKFYFERAIALDPRYALAYAGLADTYHFIANSDRRLRDEYYKKARQIAYRALELDPTLAEPHASLGLLAMNYDWDWPTSEREFKRALEMNPNYATAHHWYAFYLNSNGRFKEALEHIERARQLEPLSSIINADAGQLLMFAGRLSEAEEKLKETLRLDPGFAQAHVHLATVHALRRQYPEAIAQLKGLERLGVAESTNGTMWAGVMGYVYARSGATQKAEEILASVNERYVSDPGMDHVSALLIYIGLGRKDEAFACLENEYRARSTTMTALKTDPFFAPLRSDPRYVDLMRRVHLAP